jgi:dihydroorotase-like cyclic amidohydrolase
MLKSVLKLGAISLLAAAIAGAPTQLLAQTTNKPAATKKATVEKKAPSDKKRSGGGVHGNLAALDQAAKTITVGKHTYQITSETKIFKAGSPGTLDDGVVGEYVSLGYKAAEDGKLNATKVTFGKPEEKTAEKKKADKKTEK